MIYGMLILTAIGVCLLIPTAIIQIRLIKQIKLLKKHPDG